MKFSGGGCRAVRPCSDHEEEKKCIRKKPGRKGFTYPGALLLIVVTTISLMGVQRYWRTTMQREREKTLLFNGGRIYNAIVSYYRATPGDEGEFPRSFTELLKDPRFSGIKRHLRRVYPDPMTAEGQWQLVLNDQGRIRGVFSKSEDRPLKQGNFPAPWFHFKDKDAYRDWKFVFEEIEIKPGVQAGTQVDTQTQPVKEK